MRIVKLILFCGFITGVLSSFAHSIDSLTAVIGNMPNDSHKVNALNDLSFEWYKIDPNNSKKYANDAIEIAKKIRFKKGVAQGKSNLALSNALLDDYYKSIKQYQEVLDIYKELGNLEGISKTLCDIGVVYQMQSEDNLALSSYLEALKMERKNVGSKQAAIIMGNLGNLYDEQGDYEQAMDYYNQALTIFKSNLDTHNVGYVYGNLGLVHYNQGQYKKAIDYFNLATSIDSLYQDQFGLSDNYGNMGMTYRDMGMFEESRSAYKRALMIDQQLENKNGMAFDLAGLSLLYSRAALANTGDDSEIKPIVGITKQELLSSALEYGLNAVDIYEEIGSKSYGVYNTISNIYLELGENSLALQYKDKYWAIRNEVNSAEKAREFARIEAKQKNELNENKILLLQAEKQRTWSWLLAIGISGVLILIFLGYYIYQSRKIDKINGQLNNTIDALNDNNESKDKFFSIIAHDLINPVGGLSSALKVFQRSKDDMSEKEQNEYIDALISSASKTNDLLNNLLEWGRLQRNRIDFNPTSSDLNSLIKSSIESHRNSANAKKIKIEFDSNFNDRVNIDEYMFSSILANLLSNAIKFTNQNGVIRVRTQLSPNEFQITVTDNGVGMKEKTKLKLFDISQHESLPGTNMERGTGLGLILVKEFVDHHRGKIDVSSIEGSGSSFTISCPR